MEAHLTSGSPVRKRALALPLGASGDERLARQVSAGSERAFAVLYERYHQPIYRYCRSILHSDADAQDALQSTLAAALAALQRGQRSAPLRPWLFRIAHNETISLLRRRGPTTELLDSEEPARGSTEEQVQMRERLAQLIVDLHELPERQRSALVMRELNGLSHQEIAVALGTTPGAAKQAIFDARQALADYAEGRAMTCDDVCRAVSDGDRRALRGRRMRAHLRECTGCAAFAAAIPARSNELRALAPPLAPFAAAGLLAQLTGAGTTHAGGGLGAVVTAGAGKTVGATLATKALVGVAVLAAATAGASSVLPRITSGGHPSHTGSVHARGAQGALTSSLHGGSHGALGARGATEHGASSSAAAGRDHAAASNGLAKRLRARGAPAARGRARQLHHGRTRHGVPGSRGVTRSGERARARPRGETKASGKRASPTITPRPTSTQTRGSGSGVETNVRPPAATESATTPLPAPGLARGGSSTPR